MGEVIGIDRNLGLGEVPDEILDLVLAVFVVEQLDEQAKPLLGVVAQRLARVAEVLVLGVENVGAQQGAQVDDGLLIGRHEALGHGAEHLVRVQLLVQAALQRRVVLVLRQQRLPVVGRRAAEAAAIA